MLTVREVAERIGAKEATIRAWLRAGTLRGVMPGGTKFGYRIPESEIARLMTPPGAAAGAGEGE